MRRAFARRALWQYLCFACKPIRNRRRGEDVFTIPPPFCFLRWQSWPSRWAWLCRRQPWCWKDFSFAGREAQSPHCDWADGVDFHPGDVAFDTISTCHRAGGWRPRVTAAAHRRGFPAAFYLYKLIFPCWLGFHYDHSPMTVIRSGWLYYTWIAPAAVVVVAIATRKRFPWIVASAALFVIGAAPVLGLVPFSYQRYSTVADRYVFLSMLGAALALASFIAMGSARRWKIIASAVLLCIFGARTFAQTLVWHDDANLYANGREVNPRSRPALAGLAGAMASESVPNETPQAMLESAGNCAKAC